MKIINEKKWSLVFVQILILCVCCGGNRKSKKSKSTLLKQPPKYHLHSSNYLPRDVQVTMFLRKEETKTYLYWSSVDSGALSVTIMPCTSKISWNFQMLPDNNTDPQKFINLEKTKPSSSLVTDHYESRKSLYALTLMAIEKNDYVSVYISTEPGGPQALQTSNEQDLRILRRHRKKVTFKWLPSLVDPQGTDYCLVLSTKKNYHSLCNAQADKYDISALENMSHQRFLADSQTIVSWEHYHHKQGNLEPLIVCVGKRTQHTFFNLKPNQTYYCNLFAINTQSNLTYPFGSLKTEIGSRTKPIPLKNGKGYANFRKSDGFAAFRYKIGKRTKGNLDIYVIPCGGSVDMEITLKDETVKIKRAIEGYERIIIEKPLEGARYYFKIFANKDASMGEASGVEIYVSWSSDDKIPLPKIPVLPKINEYVPLKRCDSVTIGWIVSPGRGVLNYCIDVKEGQMHEIDTYKLPNQCGLENRLRKSTDFTAKYCVDVKQSNREKVLTKKIPHLSPGKTYVIQITVKKPKGKTLSYDLLQVNTKKTCGKFFSG